jgi:predicted AAA+ superfamily ATPase
LVHKVARYDLDVQPLAFQEVIFIAEKGGEKMYVQVALSILEPDTMNREFGNLMNIPDNYPKKVVSMQAFSGNTVNGIETQDLRSFLMT